MSSEPSGAPSPGRSFHRLALGIVLALAVVAAGLTVANALQGPGVVRADVDPVRASSVADQRWVLDLDQASVPGSVSATLTPAVGVRVDVAERRVTVRFERALDLGTTYTLHLTVTGASTHGVSRITERLTTPPAQTFLLRRGGVAGSGADDQVLRTDVRTGHTDVVFSGPAVQEISSAPPYLAVVQNLDGTDRGTVTTVRLGSDSAPVHAAGGAVVRQVRSSGTGGIFAWATDDDPTDALTAELHVLDPATGRTSTVLGADGAPINPGEWRFVPGTSQLVVQTPDLQVWLVDAWNRTPVKPLGGHSYLVDLVPGTREVVFDDAGRTALDLGTGARRDLVVPDPAGAEVLFSSLTLPASVPPAALFSRLDASGVTTSDLSLVVGTGADRRTVWRSSPGSTLERTCQSPNGQLVELDLAPAGALADGHAIVPGSLGSQAVLVDLTTGATYGPYAGSASTWCH